MRRLFGCTVSLLYEDARGEATLNAPIARLTEFWWSVRQPDARSLWESKIELGEDFFNEIIRCPIPIDLNTLRAMKRSPLGLDLYLWLTYRTFGLKRPLRLTWPLLYRQFGVDPAKAGDKLVVNDFRKDCLRELQKIKQAWPGPALPDGEGGAASLTVAAVHRAVATAARGIAPVSGSRLPRDGRFSASVDLRG